MYSFPKSSLEFNPADGNGSSAVDGGEACPLALPKVQQEETDRQRARLMHLVSTSGLQIRQADRELHKFAGSADGHHPGHVLIAPAVNAGMTEITMLERSLQGSLSGTVQAALQQAHGLDQAIAAVPVMKLQKVLGAPIAEASPDQEFDLNAVSVKPGPMGADELTV